MKFIIISLFLTIVFSCSQLDSNSKCEGCPPMYNGKPCASTTRYTVSGSACGCFETSSWVYSTYNVAPNEAWLINSRDPGEQWCTDRCGECIKLTSTGGWIQDMSPENPPAGVSITAMVTNMCPEATNQEWCGQSKGFLECLEDEDCEGHTNDYGYMVHFDLRNNVGQIFPGGVNWDNTEVTFERVECPASKSGLTPGLSEWHTCDCFEDQYDPTQEIDNCNPSCSCNLWCNDYENECMCGNGTMTQENIDNICPYVECGSPKSSFVSFVSLFIVLCILMFVF